MKKSLFLLPLAFSMSAARADLSYTQVTSSPMMAMTGRSAAGITSKVYAKGDLNRTEASIFGRKTITLARGAKSVIQIDPSSKTYTASNAGNMSIAKGMMPTGQKTPSMSMTVSTKKLATQTVRGVKAPHYLVTMDMKMGTPRGPQNVKMGMEIWGSGVAYPTSAKTRADALSNLPANFKGLFGGNSNFKGDIKGMSAAFATVPLRIKMMMNGMAISTIETSNISTKPLPASLFAVPAGYRQVSNEQFGQLQRAAMQKSMAGLMGQGKSRKVKKSVTYAFRSYAFGRAKARGLAVRRVLLPSNSPHGDTPNHFASKA